MSWKFWQKSTKEEKPKSKVREWWDAVLFAVIAATLIRWLIMEPFTIPTSSMENSMLIGDFLFVSKFHYGSRTTSTPLQVPLTHGRIWGTEIPSYVKWIQLPTYRLPGISSVKRGEAVVFNVPGIEEDYYGKPQEQWRDNPYDLKAHYVKRCVGVGGDVLEIKDGVVYTNGEREKTPKGELRNYIIHSKTTINDENFDHFEIKKADRTPYIMADGRQAKYSVFMSQENYDKIISEKPAYIISVERNKMDLSGGRSQLFPYYHNDKLTRYHNWTLNSFGPLWIPKEGATIQINDSTLAFYGEIITRDEDNKNVVIKDGTLSIDGKQVAAYTFKQNYYFMMGDNREQSLDSRYWGFVGADHLVGKPLFIWFSINNEPNGFADKIRWGRIFKSAQE